MRLSFLIPLALTLAGCPSDTADDDTEETDSVDTNDPISVILALDGDDAEGEQIFNDNCTELCHGTDGRGKAGDSALLGEDLYERVPPMSEREVVEIIYNGEGVMTGFGTSSKPLLTHQEIADVAAYVIGEFGN